MSTPEPGQAFARTATTSAPDTWRAQYLSERRKARIFMASTAVLGVLFAGTLGYVLVSDDDGQVEQIGAEDGFSVPGGFGGGNVVERFLDQDGEVDPAAVAAIVEQIRLSGRDPQQLLARFELGIARAVATGSITQEQASEILAQLQVAVDDAA